MYESNQPKLTIQLREIANIADQLKISHTKDVVRLRDCLDKLVFSLYNLTTQDMKFVLERMGATHESTQFILEMKTDE